MGRTALGLPAMYGTSPSTPLTALAISAGSSAGSTMRTPVEGAEISPGGVLVGRGAITSTLETVVSNGATMDLSYSAASGDACCSDGIVRQAGFAPSSSINTACPWGPCF